MTSHAEAMLKQSPSMRVLKQSELDADVEGTSNLSVSTDVPCNGDVARNGARRLREFNAAPASVQAAFWIALREDIDIERAHDVYLDWQHSDAPLSEEPLEMEWPALRKPSRRWRVQWDEGWSRRARAIRRAALNPQEDWTPNRDEDPLVDIPARVYVETLTGEEVPHGGHMRCVLPDHEDRNPSFRVYDGSGWRCYGCGESGTIYDLAALLWDIEPRGSGFREIHRRLRGLFA